MTEEEEDPMMIVKRMYSGAERKDLMVIRMEALCSWEQFLMPAPTSIAILGQLMAIATKQDFSLDGKTPVKGFQYVKYPTSFRACLVQISNTGCEAFMTAHKHMDKIRMYTMQFQDSVKQVVSILLRGTDDEKIGILPGMFDDMKEDASKCLQLAQDTEKKFNEVILLVDEITESSAAAKGVYEEKLKTAKERMEQLRIEKEQIEIAKQKMEEEKKRAIEEFAKAKTLFDNSVDQMPGIKTALAMEAIEQTLKMATGAIDLFGQNKMMAVSKGLSMLSGLIQGSGNQSENNKPDCKNDSKTESEPKNTEELREAFRHINGICKCIEKMLTMFEEKDDNKGKCEMMVDVSSHKKDLKDIKESVGKFKDDYKKSGYTKAPNVEKMKDLCKRVLQICDEIMKQSKKKSADELFKKLEVIRDESKGLQMQSFEFFQYTPVTIPDSNKNAGAQQNKSKHKLEIISENARYEVEMRKKELDEARREREKTTEELKKMEEKQCNVLQYLSQTDIDAINFEEIQETLKEGLIAFSDLKEQWSLLVLFFSNITNGIDVCLSQKTFKMSKHLQNTEYSVGHVTRDIVLEMAASVNTVAYSVQLIAQSYTDISKKHLVQNTASLGKLLAYNPDKDKDLLNESRRQLNADCERAREEIRELAIKSRKDMDRKMEEMYGRLKTQIEDKLPAISEEKLKAIKDNVASSGMTESDFI